MCVTVPCVEVGMPSVGLMSSLDNPKSPTLTHKGGGLEGAVVAGMAAGWVHMTLLCVWGGGVWYMCVVYMCVVYICVCGC